ncbi:hypothetical protein DFH07DRAFT_948214 [Mycena maculata]|uniref:Uncharacterized protein n=1 Tax=Mycena maculata TaxID=230809 RepID=A0AAD7P2N6_9AGAR|nr:hypothetical protein DFH07DRAFT_948214 [Mycena maculata]
MDLWLNTKNGASTITDTVHESTLTVHYLLSTTYPSANPLNSTIDMNTFLEWVQVQQGLDHLKQAASCSSCNGIPQNVDGLLLRCDFADFPFFTCYGWPDIEPTINNPNPAEQVRFRLPTAAPPPSET